MCLFVSDISKENIDGFDLLIYAIVWVKFNFGDNLTFRLGIMAIYRFFFGNAHLDPQIV